MTLSNSKGETVQVSGADARAGGFQQFIKVYSHGDQVKPRLQDVECNSPLVQNNARLGPQPVTCKFTVFDEDSGPKFVSAYFLSENGTDMINILTDGDQDVLSSSDGVHVLRASAPGFNGMAAGRWSMVGASPFAPVLMDKNKNRFSYDTLDTSTFTQAFFDVTSTPDTSAPTVQKFTCSATQVRRIPCLL
jgi:hypothetical protein